MVLIIFIVAAGPCISREAAMILCLWVITPDSPGCPKEQDPFIPRAA